MSASSAGGSSPRAPAWVLDCHLPPAPPPLRVFFRGEGVVAGVVEDPVAAVARRGPPPHLADPVGVVRRRNAEVLRPRLSPRGMSGIVAAPVKGAAGERIGSDRS